MEQEKKYIHISIEKYDVLLDDWIQSTGTYADQFNLHRVMKRFDESCGIVHAETEFDDVDHDDSYTFEVVDGKKFFVSAIKYDLLK
jgi:hypothetical protein